MGFHGQPAMETAHLADLGEIPLTHKEVREGIPSDQTVTRPTKAMLSWVGRNRLLLPDRLLLYSYIPLQGQALPIEEVSAPGPKGADECLKHSYDTRVGLSFSRLFYINYIVFVARSLIWWLVWMQAYWSEKSSC